MADDLPHPGIQEAAEIAVDRGPRRKCRGWRQVAPLTPGAYDIEQTVQHEPHISRPRPTAGFRRRDERLDQAVLIIAQRLTGAIVPNQRTILRRPHRSLQNGHLCPSKQLQT